MKLYSQHADRIQETKNNKIAVTVSLPALNTVCFKNIPGEWKLNKMLLRHSEGELILLLRALETYTHLMTILSYFKSLLKKTITIVFFF
jgi:hypothetical protein